MAASSESINGLTSDMVLGYFETLKGNFYVKVAVLTWFQGGDIEKHKALSASATEVASEFNDQIAQKMLASIKPEVVENLKEDAATALVVAAWSVFEQVIKDLTVPNYATHPNLLNADYHRASIGFTLPQRGEIDLFYYIRNAIVHYNGAYHAYKTVDVTYEDVRFQSVGRLGDKIDMNLKLAMSIADDLQRYAMQAWTHSGRA